ncbi:MAG: 4-hydroxythreonine-4-phosphate dehydrogenase PdxA [Pseudomonadota bacterium]
MKTTGLPLAITMGDPAGCGPQIIEKAWRAKDETALPVFFVIADPLVFPLDLPLRMIESPEQADPVFADALPVLKLDLQGVEALQTGVPQAHYAPAILESIQRGTELALENAIAGLVTCPISKSVLYQAGFTFPGHTEFIAHLCAQERKAAVDPVMMLVGGGLRVALATIHVPLMRVLDHLTADRLKTVIEVTDHALRRDFGLSSPTIALTGLNPHAGEQGSIGHEEHDLINPVAQTLRASGIKVSDARPADTVFHEALTGAFDAVIAMTHDQGLIPVKTLDMWGGVNTTLGLPIVRTSPDHGTAYDAAAQGACKAESLIAAMKLAQELAETRALAHA